jgi:hypothetical protein
MIDAAVGIASRHPAERRDAVAPQSAEISEIDVIHKLCRALEVALRIRDEGRVLAVRDAILAFENRTAVDHLPGLWGHAFDQLIDENTKVPLTDEQRHNIIADLEARLARLSSETDPNRLDPHVVQGATLRLARHYRRTGATADMARVLAIHTGIYLRKLDVVQPLVAASWLRDLYRLLESFHLRAEAEQVLLRYREFAHLAAEQMHPMTVSTTFSNEELENYLRAWVAGEEWDPILARLVSEYLPRQDAAEQEVRSTARSSPLASMVGQTVVGRDGRAVAQVGTVENDLEGNIVQHISRDMGFRAPFLRLVIERLIAARGFGHAQVGGFLDGCPLFESEKRPLLDEGIQAFFERRWALAVHLLVPQIEAAIRRLVELAGGLILKAAKNGNGSFHFNNLDELLRKPETLDALTLDGVRYLRILLTDQRGWNVRNEVCHGVLPADHFGPTIADRLLHTVLLIGCIRACEPSDTAASETGTGPTVGPSASATERA